MGEEGRAGQRGVGSGREQGESTGQYGVGKGLIKKRSERRLGGGEGARQAGGEEHPGRRSCQAPAARPERPERLRRSELEEAAGRVDRGLIAGRSWTS